MVQIGNVPQIIEVKEKMEKMKAEGLISEWELPCENLLTRIDAAIFFLSPTDNSDVEKIWQQLEAVPGFQARENEEKSLSQLRWQIEFNKNDGSSD